VEWWEKYPEGFLEELEKMEAYTSAQLRIVEGSQLPGNFGSGVHIAWEEIITSNSNKKYRILIVCQRGHPYSAPSAWILEPEVRRHHHMFSDGHLCLHNYFISPDKSFALNIRNWTCEWVECYETGDWRTFA